MKYEYKYGELSEKYYNGIADPTAQAAARAHDEKYCNVHIELDIEIAGVSEKQIAYAENLITRRLDDIIKGLISQINEIRVDREKRLDDMFTLSGMTNFSDLIEYTTLNKKIAGISLKGIMKKTAHDIIELLK